MDLETIDSYKRRKIPDISDSLLLKHNYRQFPIDSGNKLYNEKWEDIRDYGLLGLNHYSHPNNPPYHHKIPGSTKNLYLRLSVIQKLITVDRELQKYNLRLYFFDCYRPIEVQNYMHDKWVPDRLKTKYPDWPDQKIFSEVDKYWAKGALNDSQIDPKSPFPHSTGGAFDLTICKNSGEHLFMGSIFDDTNAVSNTDFFEKLASLHSFTFSEIEALYNRRLLFWLMTDAGFANNPTEWWHFSYGDQMWAKLTKNPAALYSKMDKK